ncbi:MAG: EAL domain-containing protein [Armatimonadetes bacterium]|nr:EAL domain-containing protein [Armatimonadota bacterium]
MPPGAERRAMALRTRLLAPIVALVVIAGAGLGAMEDVLARRQTDLLVNRYGASVLEGIARRVQERRRAKEIFVQLLADQKGLAEAVRDRDKVGAAQVLLDLKVKLGLQFVTVFGEGGGELIGLGVGGGSEAAVLVRGALAGLTQSAASVTGEGLAVFAAVPIKGHRNGVSSAVVGALVVGTVLDGNALKEVGDRAAVELAVFRDGSLINGTAGMKPAIVRLLRAASVTPQALPRLNRALARLDIQASARTLGDDGLLLALVPTGDLVAASRQRALTSLAGILVLVVLLIVAGLLLARDISRPLESMLAATRNIVAGDYHLRIPPGRVREMNDLADAVNHMAQQLEGQIAELARQASHDALTKLPNRALFMDRVDHALARARRRQESVAVMFVDLDNFKVVNDSLGHHIGDRLLVATALRFRACVRTEDTVARLGGDEFAVLLERIATVTDATRVAERIAEQLRAPFVVDGHEVFATASVGIAFSQPEDGQAERLMREADLAMYRAKTTGKSHYSVFDESMGARALRRLELEGDLRRGLERGEFTVHYQPVVDLASGRIGEVEALVRWRHPAFGLMTPGEFIPLAEETGLILPLGRWVLAEACRQVRAWQARHPDDPPLVVSVNLSPRQVQHAGLVDEIAQALHETGLDPRSLKVEITENVLMDDGEKTTGVLQRLRALGVRIAIDDFGTGYSSLSYLKRFQVDAVKIDRSFIEKLDRDPEDTAIVQAMVSLARALNLAVACEGVETAEQLTRLQTMGCDQGQGFYFARPTTGAEIGTLLEGLPAEPPVRGGWRGAVAHSARWPVATQPSVAGGNG